MVEATGGHPFWVVEGEVLASRPIVQELPAHESQMTPTGRWAEARHLRLGDHFLTRTGKSATVAGLTIRMERVQVYNLQVKNLQLYAVGQAGVLVHDSNPVQGRPRVGSTNKIDPYHRFPDVVDNYASGATRAVLRPGVDLYQIEGSLNGVTGRFEWIVHNGQVTHRMFVPGGTCNGVPISR